MLRVIKKDGGRENFSRKKILDGLVKACYKRPLSIDRLNETVDQIERELHQLYESEVPSKAIGELVMARLKEGDEVAFIRFASVYREFKDVSDFVEEAGMMLQEARGGTQAEQSPDAPEAIGSASEDEQSRPL